MLQTAVIIPISLIVSMIPTQKHGLVIVIDDGFVYTTQGKVTISPHKTRLKGQFREASPEIIVELKAQNLI